ncbi:MAG TPA: TIM barrel protein [Capsulimonadaceae bacterium]|nr:TIM barrel protein [Capsulimonadaceae bacterium]
MSIKQSFSWWCFANKGVEPQELLTKAKAIGYEAVELIGQEHWDAARDAGLVIASTGGHRGIEAGLNNRDDHARIASEIRQNLEKAVKYEIPNLIVFSGNRREGQSDAEGAKVCAEGLMRLVAKDAENAGVNLVMELLNSKVDHKGYQCDHTNWGVQMVEAVGSPRVKLLYDIYHMQIMEGDLIRTIRENHPHFGHYHTAGNPGRRDMDNDQEIYYPPIMRAIAETGYTGYVGHEFVPKADPIAALKSAYDLCNV